jgi:selenocysteine lyase/cysteine desulfurase
VINSERDADEAKSGDDALSFCPEHDPNAPQITIENVRNFVIGVGKKVPLFDGRQVPYVNFDNAATTPPLAPVLECSRRFYEWYASVHRGSGFKSLLSTHVYEKCREVVAEFVGADLNHHTVIFTQNATHALNKLAARVCMEENHTVITTMMEHHSNLLPWRKLGCKLEYAGIVAADGSLDLGCLERKVRENSGRLCLVTVTAASNVTGSMPPIRRIARLAHEHGALIAVDATQFVPHRPFDMGDPEDPERIDFAVFSAHKMYAPFGCGVLVGPKHVFEKGDPDAVGGGTVSVVTMEGVLWAQPPEKDEAGTPNVPGAIALASATRTLHAIGMENVAEHERELTRRALEKLNRLDGITLYGLKDPAIRTDRLGVIPMTADSMSHGQLAAALGYEWGIGVRSGCFCAQPFVRALLGVSEDAVQGLLGKMQAGERVPLPGMVRASFGLYNTVAEVDYLVEALRSILTDGPRAHYVLDEQYHDYVPEHTHARLDDYVPF